MGTIPRHAEVDVVVDASPTAVWEVVGDPRRTGEWSHECLEVQFVDGAAAPAVGARFRGRNRVGRNGWSRTCEIVGYDPGAKSAGAPSRPGRLQRQHDLDDHGGARGRRGTRITQRYEVVKLGPIFDRFIYQFVPVHRDRTEALTDDLPHRRGGPRPGTATRRVGSPFQLEGDLHASFPVGTSGCTRPHRARQRVGRHRDTGVGGQGQEAGDDHGAGHQRRRRGRARHRHAGGGAAEGEEHQGRGRRARQEQERQPAARPRPGTLTTPPATTASGYEATAVTGFPADTVTAALDQLGVKPNVVMSGINAGQNLGGVTDLSGTVGAARAAAARGIPALAVSQGLGDAPQYDNAAKLAVAWLAKHRAELAKKPKSARPRRSTATTSRTARRARRGA